MSRAREQLCGGANRLRRACWVAPPRDTIEALQAELAQEQATFAERLRGQEKAYQDLEALCFSRLDPGEGEATIAAAAALRVGPGPLSCCCASSVGSWKYRCAVVGCRPCWKHGWPRWKRLVKITSRRSRKPLGFVKSCFAPVCWRAGAKRAALAVMTWPCCLSSKNNCRHAQAPVHPR